MHKCNATGESKIFVFSFLRPPEKKRESLAFSYGNNYLIPRRRGRRRCSSNLLIVIEGLHMIRPAKLENQIEIQWAFRMNIVSHLQV